MVSLRGSMSIPFPYKQIFTKLRTVRCNFESTSPLLPNSLSGPDRTRGTANDYPHENCTENWNIKHFINNTCMRKTLNIAKIEVNFNRLNFTGKMREG